MRENRKQAHSAVAEGGLVSSEDLRTSNEWQKICRITVIDADGFKGYDWFTGKMSREKFEKCIMGSTITDFRGTKFKDIWMDK